jgi:hypothetical protein
MQKIREMVQGICNMMIIQFPKYRINIFCLDILVEIGGGGEIFSNQRVGTGGFAKLLMIMVLE